MSENSFWAHDASGQLTRVKIAPEVTNPTPFPYVLVTDQGDVEEVFEGDLEVRGREVDRPMELVHYAYNPEEKILWPVTAYVRNHVSGVIEVWHSKYILGCDGSGSLVRHVEGIQWHYQGGIEIWAVADVWAETDFPDIRRHCTIWSPHGNCMLMPNRENGFRVYTQLSPEEVDSLNTVGHAHFTRPLFPESNSTMLFEILQARIRAIVAPFRIEITNVAWISRYGVHQGIATEFSCRLGHIFLLGDASQTHSPQAVQGMNPGIADAHNLTWKLALVIKGCAAPELLDTYQSERQHIAVEVTRHEIRCTKFFPQAGSGDTAEFQSLSKTNRDLMTGCGHRYLESPLVQYSVHGLIDKGALEPLIPGKRLHTMALTRHVDGTVVDLLGEMPSTGHFHLVLFAGRLLDHAIFHGLSNYLASSESPLVTFVPHSPVSYLASRYPGSSSANTRNGSRYLKLYLIHSSNHLEVEIEQFSSVFDSSKIFEDVGGLGHTIHGVHETAGVMALVRPDGYIMMVTSFADGKGVKECLMKLASP